MAFKDGFKDIVTIIPVSIVKDRNMANNPAYRTDSVINNIRCRVRKTSDNEIKVIFDETQKLSKGDCVFSVSDKEMYTIEVIKPVYGKRKLHHITCYVVHSPQKAGLMELVVDE